MSPGIKLAAYAVVLAVMVALGAVVGDAVGPIDVGGNTGVTADHDTGMDMGMGIGTSTPLHRIVQQLNDEAPNGY